MSDFERKSQEIADKHDQITEFGRAIVQLESAVEDLRRNGCAVVSAYESADSAVTNMEVLFEEYERENNE